jgi:hypothetical protein
MACPLAHRGCLCGGGWGLPSLSQEHEGQGDGVCRGEVSGDSGGSSAPTSSTSPSGVISPSGLPTLLSGMLAYATVWHASLHHCLTRWPALLSGMLACSRDLCTSSSGMVVAVGCGIPDSCGLWYREVAGELMIPPVTLQTSTHHS